MSSKPGAEIQLTIDGKQYFRPGWHDHLRRRAPERHPHPDSLPSAERNSGGRLPRLRGRCRQRVYAASCIRQAEAGNDGEDLSTEPVQAARNTLIELLMSDHPSPCARQQHSGDCELERWRRLPASPSHAFRSVHAARQGRFFRCHRRRSRGLHSVRPLHSRLRRYPPQLGSGTTRQGIPGRHRLRQQICRWAIRPAFRAANAWSRAPPARSPTSASSERELGQGDVLDPAELLHLPIFQNVSGTFLELNQKAVVKRHYHAGEIICREGEFGSTAFYILEGKAEVFLSSPIAHVKLQGQQSGLLSAS